MLRLESTLPALLLLCSCRTTAEQVPIGLDQAVVHVTPMVGAWRVEDGLDEVGSVVRYEEVTGPGRHVFVVRNVHDQDLGMIDSNGRVWRLRPHAEPELLGTGTVSEGAARILGRAEVELVQAPGPERRPG